MPRYFFHLSFGQRTVPDEEGVELPNRRAARDEALAVVRDIANPEHLGNPRRWASWFLEVADETGGFFRTPIGHPALEVVAADSRPIKQLDVEPLGPAAVAPLSDSGTAVLFRQMVARRETMLHLLKHNEQLRRELSCILLASEGVRLRARRVVPSPARPGLKSDLAVASSAPMATGRPGLVCLLRLCEPRRMDRSWDDR